VPTVSLHVHERIDAKTIIEAVQKSKDDGGQLSLFDEPIPLREALAFYQHKENWSNRLFVGVSLLVMIFWLEKSGTAYKDELGTLLTLNFKTFKKVQFVGSRNIF
jgi:adenine-specific DNA-methyltransferase